jgi:hypothetical protein
MDSAGRSCLLNKIMQGFVAGTSCLHNMSHFSVCIGFMHEKYFTTSGAQVAQKAQLDDRHKYLIWLGCRISDCIPCNHQAPCFVISERILFTS